MTKKELEELQNDNDGLRTYEFIVNRLFTLDDDKLSDLITNLERADRSGQYLASAARYMNALDASGYDTHIRRMVADTIERDREHRYINDLIVALYGAEYYDRAPDLLSVDENFRRMFKRLHPNSPI